jgi:hypothetical protein
MARPAESATTAITRATIVWAYVSLAATVIGALTGYVGSFIVLWPFAAWAAVRAVKRGQAGRSKHACVVAAASALLLAIGAAWIVLVVFDPLHWF